MFDTMHVAHHDAVLLVDPSLFTAPYDLALAEALAGKSWAVSLLARPLRFAAEEFCTTIPVLPFFYRRSSRLPRLLRLPLRAGEHVGGLVRLVKLVETNRPAVVHFQWSNVPRLDLHAVRRIRRTCPVVLTLHDSTLLEGHPIERLRRWGLPALLAEADAIIVHTEAARLRLSSLPTVRVVAHGRLGRSPAAKPGPVRTPLRPIRLTLFGRLKQYKGIDLLIEAVGQLSPAQRDAFSVEIAGEAQIPTRPLHRRIAALGLQSTVRLREGYMTDGEVDDLLARTDVALFPYRAIDASGAFFRAITERIPVVASDTGVFRETVAAWGNGLLVAPGDVGSLRRALETLAGGADTLPGLSAAAHRIDLAGLDWSAVAEATLAVYALAAERRLHAGFR